MTSTNQFRYWDLKGFFCGTIFSMVSESMYEASYANNKINNLISVIAVSLVAFNWVYIIYKFIKSKYSIEKLYSPIFIATGILTSCALVSILQSELLETPTLVERTALFYFPLFASAFATTFIIFNENKAILAKISVSVLLCLMFIFHLSGTMSLRTVKEWSFDENTLEVIDYFKKSYPRKNITLKTSWYFHPSFDFYKHTGMMPFIDLKDYNKSIDINTDAEYYYLFATDYPLVSSKFDILYKISDERWILKKKKK